MDREGYAALSQFRHIVDNPYPTLAQWKRDTGGQVVGCFPMHIPHEIVHAAGILPVAVVDTDGGLSRADRYLPSSVCHVVRCALNLALTGRLDFLDGVVFPDICEAVQMTADIWRIHCGHEFIHNLTVPLNLTLPGGREYLAQRLDAFRGALARFAKRDVSDDSVRRSIMVYNENRALMKKLYRFRRRYPSAVKARDMATVVGASMLMPVEEHSRLLRRLMAACERSSQGTRPRLRLVLSGALCDSPEPRVLDLLEELGAAVVDDDLYCGSRYFTTLVNEKLPSIDALAERYVKDVPCPTKYNPANDWADHIVGMVRRGRADAVVVLMLKYCEPHALAYPHLRERLAQEHVPHVLVETDTGEASLGQIRTRLEATFESIEQVSNGRKS